MDEDKKGNRDWLMDWWQRTNLGLFANTTNKVELLNAVMEHFNYTKMTESHNGVTPLDVVDRINCLNSLGFVWNEQEAQWLENVRAITGVQQWAQYHSHRVRTR